MLRGLVRGYRRAVAQLVSPSACPICLEPVPVLGLRDSGDPRAEAFAKLRCRHKFCAACLRQFVTVKLQAREVDDGALGLEFD